VLDGACNANLRNRKSSSFKRFISFLSESFSCLSNLSSFRVLSFLSSLDAAVFVLDDVDDDEEGAVVELLLLLLLLFVFKLVFVFDNVDICLLVG
jgi:hypothetical protein